MDIKKTWEKYYCLSQSQAFALPPSKDKQRISPRRVYIQNIYRHAIAGNRYNTLEVDVPLPYLLRCSKLRSLRLEDNVRKRPLPICLDPPIPYELAESLQS